MSKKKRHRKLRRQAAEERLNLPPLEGITSLKEQFSDSTLADKIIVSNFPPGFEKMSEVIKELVRPWSETALDEKDLQGILLAGMTVWNLSLLPPDQRAEFLKTSQFLDLDFKYQAILREMLARKNHLFPHNRRQIIDYRFKRNGAEVAFDVISTLEEDASLQLAGGGSAGAKPSFWKVFGRVIKAIFRRR